MVVAWWSIIPFALLLGCIAVLPLIPATEKIWDRNLVKLIVALVILGQAGRDLRAAKVVKAE